MDLGEDGTNTFEESVAQTQLGLADAHDCVPARLPTMSTTRCSNAIFRNDSKRLANKMDNRRVIVRTFVSANTFWAHERGEDEVSRDGRVVYRCRRDAIRPTQRLPAVPSAAPTT